VTKRRRFKAAEPLPTDRRSVWTRRLLFILAVVVLDLSVVGMLVGASALELGEAPGWVAAVIPVILLQPWCILLAVKLGGLAAMLGTPLLTIAIGLAGMRRWPGLARAVYRARVFIAVVVSTYAIAAAILFSAAIDFPPRDRSVPVSANAEFHDAVPGVLSELERP